MNNTIISAREEQFRKECKVINLTYEYPGYTGIEQWAIITDLSEEELCAKYAEQVATFRPFVVLSSAFGKVRDTYIRNEHKHEMRRKLYGDVYSAEDGIEAYHPELIENDLLETIVRKEEMDFIKVAIHTLSELQKSRIVRYFFQEKTLQEIAYEDIGDVIGLTELQQYFPNLLKNENQNGIITTVGKCGKKSSLDAILHRLH